MVLAVAVIYVYSTYKSLSLSRSLLFSQVQMQETDALMEEQEFISGPLDSWLSSFLVWAANSTEYRYRETVYDSWRLTYRRHGVSAP